MSKEGRGLINRIKNPFSTKEDPVKKNLERNWQAAERVQVGNYPSPKFEPEPTPPLSVENLPKIRAFFTEQNRIIKFTRENNLPCSQIAMQSWPKSLQYFNLQNQIWENLQHRLVQTYANIDPNFLSGMANVAGIIAKDKENLQILLQSMQEYSQFLLQQGLILDNRVFPAINAVFQALNQPQTQSNIELESKNILDAIKGLQSLSSCLKTTISETQLAQRTG